MKASAELVDDPSFEFERYAAQQTAGVVMRDAVDDFWTGDGSGKPQGLIDSGAGVTTVNQATAGTVVLDDIGALCENVPAASMFTPRSGVLLSPGCYWDLRRQTLGTSAAGGMAVDASLPNFGGTLLGFRFAVDTGLEAPGNGNISAVAGDFTKAYVVRLAPLRVDTDRSHAADTDQVLARVIVRADGQPTAVGNVRALVGP